MRDQIYINIEGKKALIYNDKTLYIEEEDSEIKKGYFLAENKIDKIPHFIVEKDGFYGEGSSERGARLALKKQIFNAKTDEQKVEDFVNTFSPTEVHSVDEWIEIHHEYIGSCARGAYAFLKTQGYKRYQKGNTLEFLEVVKQHFNTELIEKIQQRYKEIAEEG